MLPVKTRNRLGPGYWDAFWITNGIIKSARKDPFKATEGVQRAPFKSLPGRELLLHTKYYISS